MPESSEHLFELLRGVNRGISKLVKDLLAEQDLPVVMMMMARQIGAEPGITISELARRSSIVKSHISNTIRELEGRGWVERRADDDDRRLVRLYLTQSAAEELGQIRKNIREQFNTVIADVSEEQVNDLIRGLEELREAIGNAPVKLNQHKGPHH